ncbi:MAG: aminotransferase class I/II-fold pyridoxal phosphate-dependent enzyme [Gemmatimonadetes bacterium]|nr:aminotransferase class I/II-fold pyridoxal phosphate-dependent enzyme [Gemmatimonadota bacterium]
MIDLRSDTVTKPSPGMRKAIAEADVGDDVLDGDPTVRKLEAKTAELLGAEAALFFPTGTMANEVAIWCLGKPGTELFVHEDAHIVDREKAGAAALAGMQPRLIRGAPRATLETFKAAVRAPSGYLPRASLLCLENTHNSGGGIVTPADELHAIADAGRKLGLHVLLDGARLWNASAASGTPLSAFASCADATMVSFSKGLGAPVGAALAGSKTLMFEAHEARRRFGGGMRQSGVLAAGCLYGIEHNLGRLKDDHAAAKAFAAIVSEAKTATVTTPETNIVMITVPSGTDPATVEREAGKRGVAVSLWDTTRVRAVTHLDVSMEDVVRAATILRDLFSGAKS